jgi:hypothetical protein
MDRQEFGSSSDEEVLDKSDPNWEHKCVFHELPCFVLDVLDCVALMQASCP